MPHGQSAPHQKNNPILVSPKPCHGPEANDPNWRALVLDASSLSVKIDAEGEVGLA